MAKLTKEEIAYYKGTESFHVGPEEDKLIGDRYEEIEWMAHMDVLKHRERKKLEDFNNPAEYELYKSVLFDRAMAAEVMNPPDSEE